MHRKILHVDMDAFFVSVEELQNPSLQGKPVVVGGNPEGRGVVAAASYAARKYGVHSALPLRTAKKLCPQALFLPARHELYSEYSQRLHRMFSDFSPLVEMVSVDEAYLDLTGCERLYGSGLRAADQLIRHVREETGLPCSIGAATSKLVSKIASTQAKPQGLLTILPGYEKQFLRPLPIRALPGVGKVTEPELHALGIRTIGDLQKWKRNTLISRFGKFGEWLAVKAEGRDTGAYEYSETPKSISHETTFDEDVADIETLERTLSYLAQRVARRLRDHGLFTRTVGMKLRYANFETLTRSRTLPRATNLDSILFETAWELFEAARSMKSKIRLLGVHAGQLTGHPRQMNLIEGHREEKLERALDAADRLRDRYGFESVQMARSINSKPPKTQILLQPLRPPKPEK